MMKTQGTKNQNTEIQSAKKAEPGILENVLRLAPAVLAVVAVALLFVLPFATYQYKQRTYGILGRSFLLGTRIAGGRHEVGQSTVLWIFVVSMAVVLVSSLIKFRKRAVSEEIMTVAGIAGSLKAIIASSSAVTPIDAIGAAIKRSARNNENSFRRFIMSFPFVYFLFAFISSIA